MTLYSRLLQTQVLQLLSCKSHQKSWETWCVLIILRYKTKTHLRARSRSSLFNYRVRGVNNFFFHSKWLGRILQNKFDTWKNFAVVLLKSFFLKSLRNFSSKYFAFRCKFFSNFFLLLFHFAFINKYIIKIFDKSGAETTTLSHHHNTSKSSRETKTAQNRALYTDRWHKEMKMAKVVSCVRKRRLINW